jgi:predicted ATP-grasp superfamily ATP-dependent carboligase
MRILVTDGEDRAALAACRALAQAGHTAEVAVTQRFAAASASRACARALIVPHSLGAEPFAQAIAETLRARSYHAVLATTDAALLAFSNFRQRLPDSIKLRLPPEDVVLRSLYKPALVAAASRVGLAVPESEECADGRSAFSSAQRFGFPVVVKPATSVVVGECGLPRREAARIVWGRPQFQAAVAALGPAVLVQRYYEGAAVLSLGGVASAQGFDAVVAARWRRRWPPFDGAACFAETVTAPQSVVEQAEALVAELGWKGIFELELLDLGRGAFAPIDFNPRPFGWMTLAIHAGANLPAIWLESLSGSRRTAVVGRPGVRYRWEKGDLQHLLWQLQRRRLRAAAAALRPQRRVAHAYFELRDPAPLGAVAFSLVRNRLRKTVTRHG